MLDTRVHPGTGLVAHKLACLVKRALGNAHVDGGLQNLRHRAGESRPVLERMQRNHIARLDLDIGQNHATAGGGLLAKGVPVVDDLHTSAVRRTQTCRGRCASSSARKGTQWANSEPVE